MLKNSGLFLLVVLLIMAISGCVPSKKLKKGEYLLVSNKIEVEKKYKKSIDVDNLYTYIQQTANQKFLFFFPSNLWIYSWSKAGKSTKFKNWVLRNFSSPPAIYDKYMTKSSETYLSRYLGNLGYFNAEVSSEEHLNKKKGTIGINYYITPNKPYSLNELHYKIADTAIAELVFADREHCVIKADEKYNYFSLEAERDRLTNLLRSKGYYEFTSDYIYYEIDSSFNDHKLDVFLIIKDAMKKDSLGIMVPVPHRAFMMNNIYVYTLESEGVENMPYDTTLYVIPNRKDTTQKTYYNFIRRGKSKIRNKVVSNAIAYNSMELFNYRYAALTSKNFVDIPIFRSTEVLFEEAKGDTMFKVNPKYGLLDCTIKTNPAALNSVGFGFDVTTSSGDWGLKANAYWENKNIFKGGEVLRVSLTGNLLTQQSRNDVPGVTKFLGVFNSTDLGVQATLMFPRFFFPINMQRVNKKFRPTTNILVGVTYQNRPGYERWISTATFGYKWKATSTMEHFLNPVEVSAVNIHGGAYLEELLNSSAYENPSLKYQYTDHLIEALHYTFLYNNQSFGAVSRNYTYFKADFETSGNLIQLINALGGWGKHPDGYKTVFGIRYAQYARFNFEARRCWYIGKLNAIAGRALFGFGIPYGNSTALPYEKAFFAGGANGMRGWQYRFLGPGGYLGNTDVGRLERMGDMQIELNAEWRFPIYSYLKGALFADVGNIWLLRNDPNFPNGTFKWSDFYKQFAFDFGVGLRLDISFIVIRLDAALPAYDPGRVDPWRIKTMKFKDVVWNFAIGYPF